MGQHPDLWAAWVAWSTHGEPPAWAGQILGQLCLDTAKWATRGRRIDFEECTSLAVTLAWEATLNWNPAHPKAKALPAFVRVRTAQRLIDACRAADPRGGAANKHHTRTAALLSEEPTITAAQVVERLNPQRVEGGLTAGTATRVLNSLRGQPMITTLDENTGIPERENHTLLEAAPDRATRIAVWSLDPDLYSALTRAVDGVADIRASKAVATARAYVDAISRGALGAARVEILATASLVDLNELGVPRHHDPRCKLDTLTAHALLALRGLYGEQMQLQLNVEEGVGHRIPA